MTAPTSTTKPATPTTTTKAKAANRWTCARCRRSWTQRQLETAAAKGKPHVHRNSSNTKNGGWQSSYCVTCGKDIDREKREAKAKPAK